jgi:copper resistance protein C
VFVRTRYSPVASSLAIILTLVLTSVAMAHALYASSTPAANATVSSEPTTVKVLFSEGVKPQGSSLTVNGPNDARVDQGDGHVDLNDPDRKTMLVSLKPGAGAGKYTVHWTTVSADDGDTASDTFVFTVAGSATPPSPAPSGTSGSASTPSLPKTGGMPLGFSIAGGLALLGLGLLARRTGR